MTLGVMSVINSHRKFQCVIYY